MARGIAETYAEGQWAATLGLGLPQLLWQYGYVAFCIKTVGALPLLGKETTLPLLMALWLLYLSGAVFLGPAFIPSVS